MAEAYCVKDKQKVEIKDPAFKKEEKPASGGPEQKPAEEPKK